MNFRLSLNFRFLRMQLHGRQLLALNGNPIMLWYPRHGLVFSSLKDVSHRRPLAQFLDSIKLAIVPSSLEILFGSQHLPNLSFKHQVHIV